MTTSTITPGTGRVTNASAASLSSHSLLILAPPPEDPDVPGEESSALSSSSVPKSAASSVPPSPSNTIFLATPVIPCARISVETADRATLRRAFSVPRLLITVLRRYCFWGQIHSIPGYWSIPQYSWSNLFQFSSCRGSKIVTVFSIPQYS